jgi:hypothetical protein
MLDEMQLQRNHIRLVIKCWSSINHLYQESIIELYKDKKLCIDRFKMQILANGQRMPYTLL